MHCNAASEVCTCVLTTPIAFVPSSVRCTDKDSSLSLSVDKAANALHVSATPNPSMFLEQDTPTRRVHVSCFVDTWLIASGDLQVTLPHVPRELFAAHVLHSPLALALATANVAAVRRHAHLAQDADTLDETIATMERAHACTHVGPLSSECCADVHAAFHVCYGPLCPSFVVLTTCAGLRPLAPTASGSSRVLPH